MIDAADRIELHELAALYGDLIDSRDWSGLDLVFATDVVWESPSFPGQPLHGLEAVRKYMNRGGHPLAHHITNIRVVEHGDEVRLHSRVILIRDDGLTMSGSYHDVVEPTEAGWRIRHRVFVFRTRPESDAS
jgi:ketosteroid isomerase-like protein